MVSTIFNLNRLFGRGDGDDNENPSLPPIVRQLLASTSSEYEQERAERCALMMRYYLNTAYDESYLTATLVDGEIVATSSELGAQIQAEKKLWNGTRSLFSIVPYAVDKDKQLTFKKSRPLPVKKDDAALEKRLTDKWERGRWGRRIQLSPFYGAVMGSSYLRVIPGILDGDPKAPSRLSVSSPEITTVLRDQHHRDRILAAKIEYQYSEADDSVDPRKELLGTTQNYTSVQTNIALGLSPRESLHRYTMIVTEDEYFTFRDHTLYAYSTDLGSRFPNTLGIVPIIEVPFNDIGEDMGLPTFYSVLPVLDAVNELRSMAGQILKNTADAPLLAYGISDKTTFTKTLSSTGQTVWHVPFPINFGTTSVGSQPRIEYLQLSGSSLAPLLEFVAAVQKDCELSLPELSLRGGTSTRAGSGFEATLDLQSIVDKIEGIRESHFEAAEDALQMALVADDAKGRVLSPDEARRRIEDARRRYDLTIYAESVLPKDRSTEAQILSVNLADGLISKRSARLSMGLTYTESIEEEKRLEVEFAEELERQRQWNEVNAMSAGNAVRPTPAGKGNIRGSATGQNRGSKPTTPTKAGQAIPSADKSRAGQPNARPNRPADD